MNLSRKDSREQIVEFDKLSSRLQGYRLNDIFADIDTEAIFVGQTLNISAFVTNRLFNDRYPYDAIKGEWYSV